jgi:uncharacterized membrane protein YhaH (DUF805 family)
MTFSQAIQSVFANYKSIKGRATRSEYWYWILFTVIVRLVTAIPVIMMAMVTPDWSMLVPFFLAALAISLFLWLLTIAVAIRRLHDQGLNGYFYLLFLIPSIGSLIELVMMLQPSQKTVNEWGAPVVTA